MCHSNPSVRQRLSCHHAAIEDLIGLDDYYTIERAMVEKGRTAARKRRKR